MSIIVKNKKNTQITFVTNFRLFNAAAQTYHSLTNGVMNTIAIKESNDRRNNWVAG